jgi:hypothetical protein
LVTGRIDKTSPTVFIQSNPVPPSARPTNLGSQPCIKLNNYPRRYYAGFLVICFLQIISCLGEDIKVLTPTDERRKAIALSLKTKSIRFKQDQPVTVTMILENRSDEIVAIPHCSSSMLVYWFVLTDNQGHHFWQRQKYSDERGGIQVSQIRDALSGREVVERDLNLRELIDFPQTGHFHLQVTRIWLFGMMSVAEKAVHDGRVPNVDGVQSNVIDFEVD